MMNKIRPIVLVLVTVLLAACSLGDGQQTAAPTQDVAQTLDAVRTQAVQTAEAEFASQPTATAPTIATATLAPTATELPAATQAPSFTPMDTQAPPPAATNTRAPVSNATAIPADYTCSVTNVLPVYLAEFAPRGEMDGSWTVKDVGKQSWGSSDVDVEFINGTNMAQYESTYNLSKNVAPGKFDHDPRRHACPGGDRHLQNYLGLGARFSDILHVESDHRGQVDSVQPGRFKKTPNPSKSRVSIPGFLIPAASVITGFALI